MERHCLSPMGRAGEFAATPGRASVKESSRTKEGKPLRGERAHTRPGRRRKTGSNIPLKEGPRHKREVSALMNVGKDDGETITRTQFRSVRPTSTPTRIGEFNPLLGQPVEPRARIAPRLPLQLLHRPRLVEHTVASSGLVPAIICGCASSWWC